MTQLLIFDAYGTLVSTGNGSVKAAERILSLQDKPIDPEAFYKEWKKLHKEHIIKSNEEMFIAEREIFAADLKELYIRYKIQRPYKEDVKIMLDSLERRIVFPEVCTAVACLRQQFRVVIGSTTDTAPLMNNLSDNKLCVDAVYTSESIQKYKPHRLFYEYILENEKCVPENAVFIGDSLEDDIFGPHRTGMKTILVDRQQKYKPQGSIQPNFVVRNLQEIIDILE